MKLVLDACVAIAMVVPEDDSPAALALRADYKIKAGRAEVLFADLLDPCPPLHPYFDYIDRAMHLSSKLRIGVFDCVYVALAEEQECHVVTSDKRFLELFPSVAIPLSGL